MAMGHGLEYVTLEHEHNMFKFAVALSWTNLPVDMTTDVIFFQNFIICLNVLIFIVNIIGCVRAKAAINTIHRMNV